MDEMQQATSTMTNDNQSSTKVKKPLFELQRKKWRVEHQENQEKLVIDRTNMKQNVYMYKCSNSVLHVKGKLNTIVMDSCKKCAVVFDELVSSCEFVNCQSVNAQATGRVPTFSIDKTDGAQVHLNQKNMDAEFFTSKSSEMNICLSNEEGDLVEYPIVEQFKTQWNGKKFITSPILLTSA